MKLIRNLLLFLILSIGSAYGALDAAANFVKCTVSTGYNSAATSIVLSAGQGAKMPATPFNLVWWDVTSYGDPSDDPNVEIVRVTNRSTDTLTITRAQEGTAATNKNTAGHTYLVIRTLTAKEFNTDIPALDANWTSSSGGSLTLSGPTVVRNMVAPDAAFSVARIDAGQIFTGVNTFTSPSLLGTVSVADSTTPAISLASGKTNTGTITINGKTSGSLILTTADATAQNVTFTVAAQTTGASTLTIPDNAGTSYTVVRSPSAGPIIFSGSTASRTKTIRDAADTILELGGSYTPTGTWTSLTMVTPVLGTPTSGALTNCTSIPVNQATGSLPDGNIAAPTITSVSSNTGGWSQFKVSGSDFTVTTALTDITGLVTGTLSISSSYEFEGVLYITETADTNGATFSVHCSVAPTVIVADYIGPTTVAANLQTMAVSGTNADNVASSVFFTTASETGVVLIKGFLTTAGSGSPVFSLRTNHPTSGTTTVKIGSVLRIRKL